eukprot:Phypoly_transcript_01528.p1 GENE.Phypoly_transcript_01528~~Phypoly_transcript_01528.p1  ORF type:complete len:1080 (+),score=256.77 Phypoly_transcript_01528:75-3314(+)
MPSCNVRVICRFRPVNKRELEEAGKFDDTGFKLLFEDDCNLAISNGKQSYNFSFDRIFAPNSSQTEVYEITARPAVEDVLAGYNGTIFAYGQTGAGKTFTMFGPDKIESLNDRGIVPRTSAHIFEHIDSDGSKREYAIKCSFLEIYKEVVKDLLNPKNADIKIRESPQKGVWVDGLTEEFVTSEQDIADLITIGDNAKSVSSTGMNHRSSRSHSLFMIIIEQKEEDGTTKIGKLNLVDLAGSEKVGKTGATGQTLEEAKKINQSLSALGNCIHALTESNRGHIPYRDSTLTRILQESLGGNTKTTLMIATSPHPFNVEETISTLMFGKRAKTIKNTVKVNKQKSAAELAALIQALKKELAALQQYNLLLEKQLDWIKSCPDYDPTKPMPKELLVAKAPPPAKTEPPKRPPQPPSPTSASPSPHVPKSSSPIPPAYSRSPSPLAGMRMGEAPITLDMARAELQKLRDASLSEGDPSHQLRKELNVLTNTDTEHNEQIEKNKQKLKNTNEQIEATTKQLEEDRRQHTTELKKLEKEKAEKKREITELSNTVQELIQQNQDLTNAIAEEEDSILILYTDNQMALEESVKVREELQSKKKVYEETKEKFDATETLANQMAEEFEQMKERCMEQEEKKKSTNNFIEQKEAELQGLEVALVKVGTDIEIEERKAKPLGELVTEASATSTRIKSQIQTTLAEIEATTRKLNEKSEAIRANIRDSLLRGYAICSHLRAASKPDALEQLILAQLTDPQTHRLLEEDVKKLAKSLMEDESRILEGLTKATKAQKALNDTELQQDQEAAATLKQKLEQASTQHKRLLEQLNELHAKNKKLEHEAAELSKNINSSNDESNALKRTISEASMNSESVYNKSKNISSELELLTGICDSLRLEIEKSRKSAEAIKFSAKDRSSRISDMKSKLATEDENMTRLNTLLLKEAKRVGSENITAALQQKRIDEQKKRIKEIEDELAQLTDSIASMQEHSVRYQRESVEFEEQLVEEEAMLAEAQAEIMHQKTLRLEQLKRNRKVFKPVQKRGLWKALEEKIDLSEKRTKLRVTASPFLKAAAEEHERSQSHRGDKGVN